MKTSPTFAKMDSQTFIEFAKTLTRLKMYPYFDVAHYILMCWTVREDNHPQATGKGRNAAPMTCYLFLEVARPLLRCTACLIGAIRSAVNGVANRHGQRKVKP